MDLRQTPEYSRYMAKAGWEVHRVDGNYAYVKRLPLLKLGLAKLQRYQKLDLEQLRQFLKREKIAFTVLEPSSNTPTGFRQNRSSYLPTKTLVLDLRLSKNSLWSSFSTNLKRILKSEAVTTVVFPSADEFYYFWKLNSPVWVMSNKQFRILVSTFGPKAKLWAASYRGQLVSGIISLTIDGTAYYYQAWTSPEGRRLKAHHHLVWNLLQQLKRSRVHTFDWEGIEDRRWPRPSWSGFTRFKRAWGGTTIEFPGSFSRWL